MAVHLGASLPAVWLVLGCQTIDRFDTQGNAAYCGRIVQSTFVWTPESKGGFDRELQLQLKLDTSSLATEPGRITTDDAHRNSPCGEGVPTFDGAKLIVTPQLANDPLSSLTFEEGQVHNIMAWVDSSCLGRMLAVVSLYKSNYVEVRIMKPGDGTSDSTKLGAFALFPLDRRHDGCEWH
jgi:hypothetical protein